MVVVVVVVVVVVLVALVWWRFFRNFDTSLRCQDIVDGGSTST